MKNIRELMTLLTEKNKFRDGAGKRKKHL